MKNKEIKKIRAESMKSELKDLGLKIEKLTEFMYTDDFSILPAVEQGLRMVQIRAMGMYYDALKDIVDRI